MLINSEECAYPDEYVVVGSNYLPSKVEKVATSLKMASFSRPTSIDIAPISLHEYFVAGCKSWSVIRDPSTEGLYKLIFDGLIS